MGIPDVVSGKSDILAPVQCSLAPPLDHRLVLSLSQMGVHEHPMFPGHTDCLDEGLLVAVHRLARGHDDPTHRERLGVMVQLDEPLAVGKELFGRLPHLLGNGASLLTRQGVRPRPAW